MLLIGQERSKFDAALAVESRCDRIVLVATATGLTLEEFQVLTTAAQRRPLLLTQFDSITSHSRSCQLVFFVCSPRREVLRIKGIAKSDLLPAEFPQVK